MNIRLLIWPPVLLFLLVLPLTLSVQAQSVFAEREFSSPEQAQIFRELAAELRCLVCQNQNIADSNAPLAQDLRREIHTMLARGDTKTQILEFMVERYGEFILYRPRFTAKTIFLWLGPLLFFIVGLAVVWRLARKPKSPAFEPDETALAEARELLSAEDNKSNTP